MDKLKVNDRIESAIDYTRHFFKIQRINRIALLMVVEVSQKGSIIYHERRVAKFPVIPLVRHGCIPIFVGKTDNLRINFVYLFHIFENLFGEFTVGLNSNHYNEVTSVRVNCSQAFIGVRLRAGFF
jgi:hypothetical protein